MRFAKALAAILVGNLIYFTVEPYLPRDLRHGIYTFDLGLMVDFCLCVAVWGVIDLLVRRSTRDE